MANIQERPPNAKAVTHWINPSIILSGSALPAIAQFPGRKSNSTIDWLGAMIASPAIVRTSPGIISMVNVRLAMTRQIGQVRRSTTRQSGQRTVYLATKKINQLTISMDNALLAIILRIGMMQLSTIRQWAPRTACRVTVMINLATISKGNARPAITPRTGAMENSIMVLLER